MMLLVFGKIVSKVFRAWPITKFDASKFKTQIAGEVKNFNPLDYFEKKEIRKYDLFTQYAVARVNRRFNNRNCNLPQ
jgi:3-oxoacyl-[acyl-carrier-protein] synthase II